MKEEVACKELAYKLKEKGYPIETKKEGILGLIPIVDKIIQPTIAQVLKWLREEKKLHIYVEYVFNEERTWICEVQAIGSYERFYPYDDYNTYEQAVNAGVNYCLENLI